MTTAKELSDQITKAMEGVTPGLWSPCQHLKSPEHDAACGCGYRGGIWGNDGRWVVMEMGSSPDIDENGKVQGQITPQADRATQLRDAAYIIATQPDNMRVILSALADAELQSTADARIAELEQQIENIKASRDLQVTIAAGEEERARKAEAERDELLKKSDWTPRYQSMLIRIESAEKDAQSAEDRAAAAEVLLQQMTEYALEVTRALTGLSGGGSEMFSGRVGNIYKADSEKCCGVVNDRHAKMHGLLVNAVKSKNAAETKLAEAVKVIDEARAALDGEPEYHYSGMGCGLEDRGITDRYDAMHHGWECALERAYGEHVIPAREAIDAFLASMKGGEL